MWKSTYLPPPPLHTFVVPEFWWAAVDRTISAEVTPCLGMLASELQVDLSLEMAGRS